MRAGALLALGAGLVVGCGSRRAPPSPAFDGPLHLEVGAVSWSTEGLRATLTIRNTGPVALSVEAVDWSIGPVEESGIPVDARLGPGCSLELSLEAPASRPVPIATVPVTGTVHTRAAGGYRRPVVFQLASTVSPSETL